MIPICAKKPRPAHRPSWAGLESLEGRLFLDANILVSLDYVGTYAADGTTFISKFTDFSDPAVKDHPEYVQKFNLDLTCNSFAADEMIQMVAVNVNLGSHFTIAKPYKKLLPGDTDGGDAGPSSNDYQALLMTNGGGNTFPNGTPIAYGSIFVHWDGTEAILSLSPTGGATGHDWTTESESLGWVNHDNSLFATSGYSLLTGVARSLTIGNASLAEGNSGTSSMAFTVTAAPDGALPISFTATTVADGTAVAGVDFTPTTQTITIPAGQSISTFSVPIFGNVIDQDDRTFSVVLSDPVGATVASGTATGTILDDDLPPTLSVNDAILAEGSSGTTTMDFTVSLSAASAKTITVAYNTVDGTAVAGSDYEAASGTLTFAAGSTDPQHVSITLHGDSLIEPSKTFDLVLDGETNATLAKATGVGTILDSGGLLLPDSYETDDTPAQAKTIPADGAAQTRTLDTLSDVDWVSFHLDTTSSVAMVTSGDAGDTQLTLYSASDTVNSLASNDTFAGSLFAQLSTYLSAGDYLMKIDVGSGASTGVAYNLTVNASSITDAYEPDNTPAQAQPVTTDGTVQAHTLETLSDIDWTSFHLDTVSRVDLVTTGTQGDTTVALYAASDTVVAITGNDTYQGSLFGQIHTYLPAGDYYVRVTDGAGDLTHRTFYNVSVTAASLVDAFEPDDTPAQAHAIATNGTVQAHILQDLTDVDWVSVHLDAPSSLDVVTAGTGDTRLLLYSAADTTNPLSTNDTYQGSLLAQVHTYLPTGDYYVKVADGGASTDRAVYNLSVTATALPGQTFTTKTRTPTYTDADGTPVFLYLTGGGSGQVFLPPTGGDAVQIVVTPAPAKANGAAPTSLIITTTGKNSKTSVAKLVVNGSINAISAKTTDLLGDLTVTGGAKSIQMANSFNTQTLSVGLPSAPKDTLTLIFADVANMAVTSQSPIKAISALDWGSLTGTPKTIAAPWIGSLKVTAGNFAANLSLSGTGTTAAALGALSVAQGATGLWDILGWANAITVKGVFQNGSIRASGNMKSLTLGEISGSSVIAGYQDGVVTARPATAAQVGAGTINSLKVTGWKVPRGQTLGRMVINSTFTAAAILSAKLVNAADLTGTTVGVYTLQTAPSLKILTYVDTVTKTNSFTWKAGSTATGMIHVF